MKVLFLFFPGTLFVCQVTTFNAIVETSYTFKGLRRIPTLRDLLEWGRRLATFGHIRPRATAGFLTLQEREGVVVEVRRTVQVFNSVMYSQPSTSFGSFGRRWIVFAKHRGGWR